MEAVRALPAEEITTPPASITLDGEEVAVPPNAFTPLFSYQVGGMDVHVLHVGDAVVTVSRTPASQ